MTLCICLPRRGSARKVARRVSSPRVSECSSLLAEAATASLNERSVLPPTLHSTRRSVHPDLDSDPPLRKSCSRKFSGELCLSEVLGDLPLKPSKSSLGRGLLTFEMSCDMLCIRTMQISYVDHTGRLHKCSKTGYNAKIHLLPSSTDIEVSFSVVGGMCAYMVDRDQPGAPWVKDANGKHVPELFRYMSDPPAHVQYFIRGPSLHSWVAEVDEREASESLLEMVSRDLGCIRTMHVSFSDPTGERRSWSGTGYNVGCHLPSAARDVEISFTVVGGGNVLKVDRRDPQKPWVKDADGQYPIERFCYEHCPPCARFDIRGPLLGAYISHVYVQEGFLDFEVEGPAGGISDSSCRFDVPPDEVPCIGGVVGIQEPHNEFLLPSEVVLFEPSDAEYFHTGTGARQIFLNTPLKEKENVALAEFHKLLAKRGIGGEEGLFPRYMEQHALRILQQCKFNTTKAAELMKSFVKERVRRLPISEASVIDDLRSGFIYWHGRDLKCRPCLVIRIERLGELAKEKERAVCAVIFTLEYALRYAMVPGRVENWVVLIDLANATSALGSPLQIGGLVTVATAIGTTLERVFPGRMAWMKILNMPGGALLSKIVNGAIPSEKKDKVSFPRDVKSELAVHFELNQLESRYGGTAPDLEPGETYPYHFFPNARGDVEAFGPNHPVPDVADDCAEQRPRLGKARVQDTEAFSVHESLRLEHYEGQLWDESSDSIREKWAKKAEETPLTPAAAEALTWQLGKEVKPCRELETWLEIVNPAALQNQRTEWSEPQTDSSAASYTLADPPIDRSVLRKESAEWTDECAEKIGDGISLPPNTSPRNCGGFESGNTPPRDLPV